MDDRPRASVSLPFGPDEQHAYLPDGWGLDLVVPMGPADLPEPRKALGEVLDSPLQSPPLPQVLPRTGRVLIALTDRTRAGGKKQLLPLLLDYLAHRGVRGDRVHLMFALGAHRRMSRSELEELADPQVLDAHPHFQHDRDGPARRLGKTSRGTLVALNERLWDYQLIIPVCGVTHHYLAGFTGGREMLVPGAASRENIQGSHRLFFQPPDEGGGRRPGVGPGRLRDNAVQEDYAEAARMFDRPVFLVSLIRGTRPDTFAGFWAGDLFRAHLSTCRTYLGWKAFPFAERYDLVLSASGGHPFDSDLLKAHHGLDGSFRLVKPGGTIVHLAECPGGPGASDLEDWLTVTDLSDYESRLRSDHPPQALAIYAIKEKSARTRILFVSTLPQETVEQLGMHPAPTLAEALSRVIPTLPPNHTTALFPDAAGMLPVLRSGK